MVILNDNLHTYCMCAGIGVATAARIPSRFRVAAEQLTTSSSAKFNRKMYAIIIMYICVAMTQSCTHSREWLSCYYYVITNYKLKRVYIFKLQTSHTSTVIYTSWITFHSPKRWFYFPTGVNSSVFGRWVLASSLHVVPCESTSPSLQGQWNTCTPAVWYSAPHHSTILSKWY